MVFNTDAVRIPYNDHTLRYPERTQAPTSQFSRRGRLVGSQPKWRPHPAGARPRDVLEVPTLCNGSKEKTSHPTQKPEELIRKLLLASSHEGELVIDPFGGAGTTYAACEALRRRWLGCESNEEYCRLIASRLADAESFRALSHSETPNRRAARRALLRESR